MRRQEGAMVEGPTDQDETRLDERMREEEERTSAD